MIKFRCELFREREDDLIKKLKSGHQDILNGLEDIEKGVREGNLTKGSYAKVKAKARVFQNKLLSYLGKQNFEFFQELELFFQGEHQELKMIEFLKKDLNDTKVQVITFFELHPCDMGDVNPGNFSKDFFRLGRDLIVRIKVEEDYLFSLLERLIVPVHGISLSDIN